MKFKAVSFLLIAGIIAMGFAGKFKTTPVLFPETVTLEDQALSVTAKVYSSSESEHILKTDLVARGYVPVEITIRNPGEYTYAISLASTAMNCARPKEIAWKESMRGIPRAVVLKVLSLFFWPFTIPSAIDSIYSLKKHTSTVSILTAKGLKEDDEIVLPYSLVKRVLYIPEESFYNTFSFSLENLDSKELVVIPVKTT